MSNKKNFKHLIKNNSNNYKCGLVQLNYNISIGFSFKINAIERMGIRKVKNSFAALLLITKTRG